MSQLLLFQPLELRGVILPNRVVISPMCQYSAVDGLASDWHLVHLGNFTQGGFGVVMVEATAVVPEGRITHGDLGLWNDAQQAGLARGVDVIDCWSGGLMSSATVARIPHGYGFQVPYAETIRREAEIATMAVGLILYPLQAEDVLAQGQADLIAIAAKRCSIRIGRCMPASHSPRPAARCSATGRSNMAGG